MSSDWYDVAIVGAGPAGATAAILLAQHRRRVVLIDRTTFPQKTSCLAWLSTKSLPLLTDLKIDVAPLSDQAFRDVTFYNAELTKTAKPCFDDPPGYLIDRTWLTNELVAAAIDQGVVVIQGCEATDLTLKESSVVVQLADGRTVEAGLLLLALGFSRPLLDRTGISFSEWESLMGSAQVEAPLDAGAASGEPRVGVVLGLEQSRAFGLCCVSKHRVSVGVHHTNQEAPIIPSLVQLCRVAFEQGVVPVDLSGQAGAARVIHTPVSMAIDMDSHVGKHTLVIGEAGGFVSAASHEGIYPAMWSAKLAVEVVNRALENVHSQDELMTFNATWRMHMADYIRSPHADVSFLLPLVFTNQPMANRMGASFFCGENL